jgi:hypothetical protein
MAGAPLRIGDQGSRSLQPHPQFFCCVEGLTNATEAVQSQIRTPPGIIGSAWLTMRIEPTGSSTKFVQRFTQPVGVATLRVIEDARSLAQLALPNLKAGLSEGGRQYRKQPVYPSGSKLSLASPVEVSLALRLQLPRIAVARTGRRGWGGPGHRTASTSLINFFVRS